MADDGRTSVDGLGFANVGDPGTESPNLDVADAATAIGADGGAFSAVLDANGGESLIVPGGDFLLTADYVREGPDLLLISADGTQVLVRDFFSGDAPPDLFTEFGARISGDLAETLAGPEFPGQYAQAAPGDIQPIGQVEVAEGDVFATRADGTRVALGVGDSVFQGDVLETAGNGTVGLVFVDDTTFSLGGDGRMVLDELVFDPGTNEGTSSFNIVQGVFSFVSGKIAASGADQMTVSTPVVTIGIRGTQVAGVAAAEGEHGHPVGRRQRRGRRVVDHQRRRGFFRSQPAQPEHPGHQLQRPHQ